MKKTNAMRMLDRLKIEYQFDEYDVEDKLIDGLSVSSKTGLSSNKMCKTLVCSGRGGYYVYVIPVKMSLDLKLAALAAGEKKIEMIPQKNLQSITGYVHGGCSPLGMKKLFPTYIDESVKDFNIITVSGGMIGMLVHINPGDLLKAVDGVFVSLGKEE
ncbi:MAG: Cys-tRNA(Pro) deacylase [Tissierellia bacterium]|nr:Cys-tRNA(Pro) deacylase [Tissierellia bacterium]